MPKQQILYFSSNDILPGHCSSFVPSDEFSLQPYTIGEEITTPYFLLFSPIWQYEHFISCDKLWKQYLQQEYPTIKFITVGTIKKSQPNYIDILHPPTNFNLFLNRANTVVSDWTPVNTGGVNLAAKLNRFLEGHGTDSVVEIFSSLRRDVKVIDRNLILGDSLQRIKQEYSGFQKFTAGWTTFRNRFSNYFSYFECVPFFFLFQKIYIFSEEIHPFFANTCQSEDLFHELAIPDKIAAIQQLLSKIRKYAH